MPGRHGAASAAAEEFVLANVAMTDSGTAQTMADRLVRLPVSVLPADTRVQVPSLGPGNYRRHENLGRFKTSKHWVQFDGCHGGPLALTTARKALAWDVLDHGAANVTTVMMTPPFEIPLRPCLTVLDLHLAAGRGAGNIPPHHVQLAIDGTRLLQMGDMDAALQPASAAGVHAGTLLVRAVLQNCNEHCTAVCLRNRLK